MSARSAAVLLCLSVATTCRAELIVNGGFETRDLSGWTTFTTPNGTLGTGFPQVVSFDTAGTGTPSLAAVFSVGQVVFTPGIPEGGGILQTFSVSNPGPHRLSADIAATTISPAALVGAFSLAIDGATIEAIDLGIISFAAPGRHHFDSIINLSAGTHELRILIVRPSTSAGQFGMEHYVDNVSIAPIPEPSSISMLAIGTAAVIRLRYQRVRNRR